MSNDNITFESLNVKDKNIKTKDEIYHEKILVGMYNNHFINIVKNNQDLPQNLEKIHQFQTMINVQSVKMQNCYSVLQK